MGADYNRTMKSPAKRTAGDAISPIRIKRHSRRTRNSLCEALPLLGGLSPEEFIREYWQKKPFLIRAAVPGFGTELTKTDMLDLCRRDDVESRFVSTGSGAWQLERGPFSRKQINSWRAPWSVLVQSVNLIVPFGEELIRRFNFLPYARLDDLMVSYATDGGGVGPHIDNYDVFLLQGQGRRRWRIGRQKDTSLVEGLPLRILKNFTPTYDWILEPGDMLYLPPDWAHDGTALGECMTWSIGFRAPPAQELADQFLTFLQESLSMKGVYRDPDLVPQRHPAEISAQMIDRVASLLEQIRWQRRDVQTFLGKALTEPKPQVFFDPPETPLTRKRFRAQLEKSGVRLDSRSQMLFSDKQFFLNGELITLPVAVKPALQQLADTRRLLPSLLPSPLPPSTVTELADALYEYYLDGFLHIDT